MTEPNVIPYYIQVARALPEPVPVERERTYGWLGERLLGGRQVEIRQPRVSIYLTPEQMRDEPSRIWDLLEAPPERDDPTLIVLDLAHNPYHLLRDIFLGHIAKIVRSWAHRQPRCRIAVLLPLLPPRISLFWAIDDGEDGLPSEGSRVTVVCNEGVSEPIPFSEPEHSQYRLLQLRPERALRERLKQRIVRKVGHYELGTPVDPHCTRFYFEIAAAEREIGELITTWARERIRPKVTGGRFTLVSHGKDNSSFHAAVGGAAAVLGCTVQEVKLLDPPQGPFHVTGVEGVAALVLDVVHTGRTYRDIVSSLKAQGVPLAPEALTVMTTDPERIAEPATPKLHPLCDAFEREKTAREECHQCLIGLPHTRPREEGQIGLRTFDMWGILGKAAFQKEAFGPPERVRTRMPFIPDTGQIFDAHGPWLAQKISDLLEWLRISPDVVFVCPKEPHIERLVTQLGFLRQNRQLTIQIPRSVLSSNNLSQTLAGQREEDWHHQLRHLGRRNYGNIVLLDEFVRSHTTARSMLKVMQHREFGEFGLEPRAYIPIIDFSVDDGISVPTYPLYKLAHP